MASRVPCSSGSRAAGFVAALGVATALSLPSAGSAVAHGSDYGDPAHPASATAPLVFRSAVTRVAPIDERPRDWRALFETDGSMRADPPLAARRPDPSAGHGSHGASRPVTLLAPPASAARADTTARIVRVDREYGRVELAHGPIPKLDMPAMTMVFRVRHPSLLDALVAGETVGLNVERTGTTYFITGVVR